MTNLIKALCLIAGLAVIGACGDDGDGGGSSGVSGSKKASELSDDDQVKLCEFAESLMPKVTVDSACTLAALTPSTPQTERTQAECEEYVTTCKAQLTEEDLKDDDETDCSEEPAEDLSACEATVSEIEGCLRALGSAVKDLFATTCAEAPMFSEEDLSPNPPECEALDKKCPDSDSDESNGDLDGEATSSDKSANTRERSLGTTLSRVRALRSLLRSRL